MRAILWLPLVAVLVLIPTRASAVTLEQVVSLAHAGVTDAVILAMLKSGRDEGDQAARADSAYTAATIAAAISPGPQLLIVGHGPEVPNTAHADGFYSGPPASGFYAFPSQYPYPSFRSRSSFRNNSGRPSVGVRPQSLCFAQVTTGRASVSPSLGFVTECPAVMQPRRRP